MADQDGKRKLRIVDGKAPHDDVVIAHISDLHFTTSTNTEDEIWRALRLDVKQCRPSLIVVTGDLIDNSVWDWLRWRDSRTALEAARTFLVELCEACEVDVAERLVVIPGNHDYRIKGNLLADGHTERFRSVFASEFVHSLYLGLGLVVLAFDSNPSRSNLDLATGEVPVVDLLDAVDVRRALSEPHAAAWNSAIKIALLHHHPMPIAATEGLNRLTEVQSFLLLRNAGRFMTQMVDERIDVVLHGHRHYPAFSRATYDAGHGEHTIAVVAAGSVNHSELHDRSYNVVMIGADRQIVVERRTLSANQYKEDRTWTLRNYRQARELRYDSLVEHSGGRLKGRRYSRHDAIQRDSGDDVITERFDEVTALGEAVARTVSRTWSKSGYFSHPEYVAQGGQQISWTREESQPDGSRRAVTTYDPPIADTPISFRRRAVFTNAIHFSRRDRLDATDQESSEESVVSSTIHAYKQYSLSVSFPPEHYPEQFRVVVLRPDETPDYREQEFVAPHLIALPDVNTVMLSIEWPLPGYEYKIVWPLPRDTEAKLGAQDAGHAAAIVETFLSLSRTRIRELLMQLVADFDATVTADLFIYEQDAGGQRIAATTDDGDPALAGVCVRSGIGPVGRAYRRRAIIVTAPVLYGGNVLQSELAAELNPFPSPTKTIVAVPVSYPLYSGRRIGTIVLRTESNSSLLHGLGDDQIRRVALHDRVQSWFIDAIAEIANVTANVSKLPEVDARIAKELVHEISISDITISGRVRQHKPLAGALASIYATLSAFQTPTLRADDGGQVEPVWSGRG